MFNRVFHRFSAIQECQYCQLCLNCAIRKELDHRSLQPWNVILLYPLISNLIFTVNKEKKLQIYGSTIMTIMPILPILCVCEKAECTTETFFIAGFIAYLAMEHGVYVPPGAKWLCRVKPCILFISFLCSTLFILSMTFDRFYSIVVPHKAALFNTFKRAKITVTCITIVSILYNLPHLFLSSHVNWECVPFGNAEGNLFGEFYYWLSVVIQFALPFILLLIMNSIIIHKIRNRFVSELQVFAILLLVTFAFLILSTPAYLFFLFVKVIDFFKTPRLFAGYYLFYNVAYKMHFTNHGINFLLYVISGKKFRTDLVNIFRSFQKRGRSKESLVTTI